MRPDETARTEKRIIGPQHFCHQHRGMFCEIHLRVIAVRFQPHYLREIDKNSLLALWKNHSLPTTPWPRFGFAHGPPVGGNKCVLQFSNCLTI